MLIIMKKVLGFLVCLALIASTSFPVSAAGIPTTITLTISPNPSVYWQDCTFTAAVSPAAATGTVTFTDLRNGISTSPVPLSGGTATYSMLGGMAPADRSYTATYSGDSNYASSTSTTVVWRIIAAPTTTYLSSSQNPSTYGQTVTYTAIVSSNNANGYIRFLDGSTWLDRISTTNGQASFSTSSLSGGTHSIKAIWEGDPLYASSTSPTISQVVNPAPSTVTLTTSPNPSLYGQAVTYTATVSPAAATGTVAFKDGSNTIGTGTVSGGAASIATSSLSAGSHSITAVYDGCADYSSSTSSAHTQVIQAASTTTTLTSDRNPSTFGQAVTFTAAVPSDATGTVTFKDGADTIGTDTVSGGAASIATSSLSAGSHEMTAIYGGDSNYNNSISSALTQVVNAASTGGSTSHSIRYDISTASSGNSIITTTTAEGKIDGNGNLSAVFTAAQLADTMNKAAAEAAKQGDNTNTGVELKIKAPADAKSIEAAIPKSAIDSLVGHKISSVTISTPIATLTFDPDSLDTIAKEAGEDIKFHISKVDQATLSSELRETVGNRPVFNFSVTSGDKNISQFYGNVTVSAPYTPAPGEDTNAVILYYINSEGSLETVSNGRYDPETGTVVFVTDHFSQYAVGYNKVRFKDVAENAWYENAVSFVAARGIATGTGDGNYNPSVKITRGEFLVMLMRAYDWRPDTSLEDNFSDAGNTYYSGYLAAAKRLGLSNGTGNNLFEPGKSITRQEMCTLLYQALKVNGYQPESAATKTLSAYHDADDIAVWAKDAMTQMVEAGTVNGFDGMLAPSKTASRAEMSQILYNLLFPTDAR